MEERQKLYAHALGLMASEGDKEADQAFGLLRKFQHLNPKSLIEKAMECRTSDELFKLAEETKESSQAFQIGYEKGVYETSAKPLPRSLQMELQKRWRYIKSNLPETETENAILEFACYVVKLLDMGYRV